VRKESAPNDETSLPQALQGREIARYLNRRFSIDCSDQLTGRSLVKVSSLERLHFQIAALAARSIMLSILSSPRGVACAARTGSVVLPRPMRRRQRDGYVNHLGHRGRGACCCRPWLSTVTPLPVWGRCCSPQARRRPPAMVVAPPVRDVNIASRVARPPP